MAQIRFGQGLTKAEMFRFVVGATVGAKENGAGEVDEEQASPFAQRPGQRIARTTMRPSLTRIFFRPQQIPLSPARENQW